MKKIFGELNLGINYILLDESNINTIISDIETPAFGYPKKLIIIRDSGILKKECKLPIKEKLKQYISENMEIIWYDSMIDDGRIFWQNRLTEYNKNYLGDKDNKLSDGMFLNFWWTNNRMYVVDPDNVDNQLIHTNTGDELKESGELAESMGRSKYDLYAGIDVQANGYNTQIKWERLFPEGKEANTSLGLYCPSWTYDSSSTVEEFLEKEERFWVNENGDPREKSNEEWKGEHCGSEVLDEKEVNPCHHLGFS